MIGHELGNRCIREVGYQMCSCIETDIARGGDGRICTIPTIPAQQPIFDPWENPFKDSTLQPPNITF